MGCTDAVSVILNTHKRDLLMATVVGADSLRVPYPRNMICHQARFVQGDLEFAEIYSMSITHQLHCLVRVCSRGQG